MEMQNMEIIKRLIVETPKEHVPDMFAWHASRDTLIRALRHERSTSKACLYDADQEAEI